MRAFAALLVLALLSSHCSARTTATLAAFNIQIFGETKINKPDVVRDLVTVCRSFDFVAIQVCRWVTTSPCVDLSMCVRERK